MKKTVVLGLAAAAVAAGLILAGCGGAEQSQTQTPAAKTEAAAKPQAAAYPIDYCIVSGEKLGEMGDPVTYDYKGRTVKFCCKNCIKSFEENPTSYIAKLDSAAAGMMMDGTGHEGHNH